MKAARPLNITMANDLGGLLFNGQKRPESRGRRRRRGRGWRASIRTADRYFDPAAWTDPGPLQFGNAPRRDGTVRGFPVYSEDLNIFKVFPLKDGHRIRFESMFGNLFNRTLFCDPNTNWSAAKLRAGQSPMQSAAVGAVRRALRFLIAVRRA